MNVWGDEVLYPRWAIPHLVWELDPNVAAADPMNLGVIVQPW